MLKLPATTLFYLPGLVHQFGNVLLTMQGLALRLQTGSPSVERSLGSLVAHGSTSLAIMRILLGERSGNSALAVDLLEQLVALGRVPAREQGIAIEMRGGPRRAAIAVPTETFVRCCGEALRVWVTSLPAGAAGVLTTEVDESGGGAVVRFGFEPATGTLPFPAPCGEIEAALADQPWFQRSSVQLRRIEAGSELRFPPCATSSAWEA